MFGVKGMFKWRGTRISYMMEPIITFTTLGATSCKEVSEDGGRGLWPYRVPHVSPLDPSWLPKGKNGLIGLTTVEGIWIIPEAALAPGTQKGKVSLSWFPGSMGGNSLMFSSGFPPSSSEQSDTGLKPC